MRRAVLIRAPPVWMLWVALAALPSPSAAVPPPRAKSAGHAAGAERTGPPDDPAVLEIFPPFRFELGSSAPQAPKWAIVEAGSDAEFRALNARSAEAQMAPKNRYLQQYLESTGPGSLRISRIISGDPVIVGAVFVHQLV